MKKNAKKKGFTLVELIVVIAILGILAAVAVPRLSGFQDSAKQKVNMSNAAMLQSVVNIYRADKNALPTAISDLQVDKYLGTSSTIPVPQITTSTIEEGSAAASTYFVMDTNGNVSISTGTTGLKLSGVSK